MGVKMMPLPEDPHVRFAGTLPDEERFHALEAATVVDRPVAARKPVAAGARGDGRRHAGARQRAAPRCSWSTAAAATPACTTADRWEFTEALKLLMKDSHLRAAMGRNGKAYVNKHYRWSTILRKYERLFQAITGAVAASVRADPRAVPAHRGDRPGRGDRGPPRRSARARRPARPGSQPGSAAVARPGSQPREEGLRLRSSGY